MIKGLINFVNSLVVVLPSRKTLTLSWNFGRILGIVLVFQILTGTFLAIYLINPIIDSFVYYIPSIVTYFFIILFIIDFFVTLKRRKVHR